MKYISKLIVIFLFGIINLFAQAPDTAWTKVYGGSNRDQGSSVQQTSDGGYIITGRTESYGAGDFDVYLIKTDSVGDTLWTKTYGGGDDDGGESVQQTTDGGYIIAGYTHSYGTGSPGFSDVYLIKTDPIGDTLWTRTYGGTSSDAAGAVQQTPDGGYIMTGVYSYGTGDNDVYLIKTDSTGDTIWTKKHGGTENDLCYSVQQTSDKGYILAGRTESYGEGSCDAYLIKTDSIGDTLWTRAYGGGNWDDSRSVRQISDGKYIVAGYTDSYGAGETDFYLLRMNSSGDTLWTKTYGGTEGDWGHSVRQTSDGGYIIAGYSYSYGTGASDIYLIKTDSLGDTLWTKTVGGNNIEYGKSIQQTSDGGYIVCGETLSYGAGDYDIYLIKINPEVSGIKETTTPGTFSLSLIGPNPFKDKTTVRYELTKSANVNISIYNMLGQKVRDIYSGNQYSGIHSVSWDGTGDTREKLSSGSYLLKVKAGDKEAFSKLTLVK